MYFIRYGKEDKLVNLFGVMQALVSIVQDDKDNLRLSEFICVFMYLHIGVHVCSTHKHYSTQHTTQNSIDVLWV